MLKKTKKLVFALSFLSLMVSAGVGLGAINDVRAGAQTANVEDLYITEGASVRVRLEENELGEESYDTAIRFTANASADLVGSLVETTDDTVAYKTGAELGMFIVPESYIDDYNQSEYNDYFNYFKTVKNKTKEQISYVCSAEDLDATNGTTYRVAIMKLLEKNYNRAYQSVAYYTLDGANYYYSEPSVERTVSQVIDVALQTDTPYAEGQKEAMAGVLERAIELKLNAEGTGENALHTVAIHGDQTVDLKARFAYGITAPDLAFTVVEGSEAVELNNGVVSALMNDSTAKVNITAYNGLVDFDVVIRTLSDDATEVIDFAGMNDLETAKVVSEGSATTISYLDSYEGATGVAKMTATSSWGHFGFQPVNAMDTYADSYYIVFRMYIADGFNGVFWFGGGNNCLTAIETGKWVDYYFPAQVFKKNWANCASNYYVGDMALVANSACELYVDEIYTVNTSAMAENEVNSFSDATQIKSLQANGATLTYQDSYEGATGVVKATATGTWKGIGIKPLQDMSVYADSAYIVFRMYIVSSGVLWFGGGNNCLTTIKTGEWVDYYFPAQVFKKNWANWTTNYNVDSMALVNSTAFEVYIDNIYTTGTAPTGDKINTFDNVTQQIYSTANNNTSVITWEESYQGATGVAKVTTSGGWGFFSVKPLQDMSAYENSQYVVFRMYFVDGFSGSLWFGDANNCLNLSAITAGKWVNCYFPAEVFKTNWEKWTINYDAQKMSLAFSANVGTVYIDEIYTTNITPLTGNEILNFSEEAQICYTVASNSTITWQESFEGETGVVKVEGSSWGYFGFKPLQDMSVYADYEYVVMRMYIDNFTSGKSLWFGDGFNCKTAVQTDAWVDYYFPCSSFTTCWANWQTDYKIGSMSLSANCAYTIYIDEIFVANEMPA